MLAASMQGCRGKKVRSLVRSNVEGFGELQLGDVTSVDTRNEYCIFDLAQKIFFPSVGHCGAVALSSGNIP